MMSFDRSEIRRTKLWVVKIGSALLTDNGRGLDVIAIERWVAQMAFLRQQHIMLVLVSSGAIAVGMRQLGWNHRPMATNDLQAAAAVGQMGLIQTYEQAFKAHGLQTAQVLLDNDDLSNRQRYLNARSTLKTLLNLGVITVVNENDTVVTDEIRFGDNDTLAALVANLIQADLLVILTDQEGMYTADPRRDPHSHLIRCTLAKDSTLDSMATGGGNLGRGGMITKVKAARLAARSGTHSIIVGGRIENVLQSIFSGEEIGTLLLADQHPQAARKLWLAGHLQSRGEFILDSGAVNVLCRSGKSLLPIGVKTVSGRFSRGDLIICKDEQGREIARGLVNYGYQETCKIIGKPSESIEHVLGYKNENELIHRDNLVLV
jgi:glutamate 5-kinase